MEKLKKRWGIDSNFQIAIIFLVFALTGSASAKLAVPLTEYWSLSGNYRLTQDDVTLDEAQFFTSLNG